MLLAARAVEIVIDAKAASDDPYIAAQNALKAASSLLTSNASFVLTTSSVEATGADFAAITAAIGLAAATLVRRLPIDGMILTGGATAAAVLKALSVKSIKLSGELEPGIPIGWIEAPRRMAVITKAGGFGSINTLANAAANLRGSYTGVPT